MLGWPLKVTISRHTGFDGNFTGWEEYPRASTNTAELDYDMWLGPALQTIQCTQYMQTSAVAGIMMQWLGDMGQHYIDPVQYILGKDNTSR